MFEARTVVFSKQRTQGSVRVKQYEYQQIKKHLAATMELRVQIMETGDQKFERKYKHQTDFCTAIKSCCKVKRNIQNEKD